MSGIISGRKGGCIDNESKKVYSGTSDNVNTLKSG